MQRPDEIQARAGLIASESSLLGLGAGTLVSVALAVALQGRHALPVLRPAVAAAAGLLTCGVTLMVFARRLDVGASARRPQGLPQTFRPTVLLAAVTAAVAWLALVLIARHEAGLGATTGPAPYGPGAAVVAVVAALAGVPLLGALGLRQVAAAGGATMPVAQLLQATGHSLLGGFALLMLIGFASRAMTVELKYTLGTAITTLGAHTILWSTWLLRGSRQAVAQMRADGVRMPLVERGHWLASAAVVAGLLVPGLVVLANLVTVRDTGLAVACSVLAVSNHAMRYAWVLLPLGRLKSK